MKSSFYIPAFQTVEQLRLALAAKQATVHALMKGFQSLDFPLVNGLASDVLDQPAATIEHLGGDWYYIFILPDGRLPLRSGMYAVGASPQR